jgi:nucleoside-diphosphate-sugar epimerase
MGRSGYYNNAVVQQVHGAGVMGVAGKLNVVTGATGLLGSHVAEKLIARGERVRALVRPAGDTTFLQQLGVELVTGDLADRESLRQVVDGADVVYHCAARVGDWGPWKLFREQIVDATANLLDACRAASVGRVLHTSSVIVYGHPKVRSDFFTEDEPLGQHPWVWDYYCRAKIKAEELYQHYERPWTIVRPSWIYGERDRTTLPRVLTALAAGRVLIVGRGDNLLNVIYAGDVADGMILAANNPAAVGRMYNLSSEGEVTQRWFIDHLCEKLDAPPVRRHVAYRIAFWAGFMAEVGCRALRFRKPPHLTRYAVALIARPTRFSIERAKNELGWMPKVGVAEGFRRVLNWYSEVVGRPVRELLSAIST